MINTPIKQEITAAGFVAIRLPINTSCTYFSLWTEDGSDYYISDDSAGANEVTIPSGFPFAIEMRHEPTAAGTIICYAKGSGTVNLVGLITK